MTKDEIGQIGEEMVKVLSPVYEQLDRIEKVQNEHTKILTKHSKILDEHTGKIDALTVDVKELQDDMGGIRDDIKGVKETHKKDISEIREHLGLANP